MCFYRRRDLPLALLKIADQAERQSQICRCSSTHTYILIIIHLVSRGKRSLRYGGVTEEPSTSDETAANAEVKEEKANGVEETEGNNSSSANKTESADAEMKGSLSYTPSRPCSTPHLLQMKQMVRTRRRLRKRRRSRRSWNAASALQASPSVPMRSPPSRCMPCASGNCSSHAKWTLCRQHRSAASAR